MCEIKLKAMAECVEAGIEFLDERRPGWLEKIDLSRFHIGSSCDCVLGQVEGDYERGCGLLGLDIDGDGWGDSPELAPATLGFATEGDYNGSLGIDPSTYGQLQEAWVRRLIQLKAERGVS